MLEGESRPPTSGRDSRYGLLQIDLHFANLARELVVARLVVVDQPRFVVCPHVNAFVKSRSLKRQRRRESSRIRDHHLGPFRWIRLRLQHEFTHFPRHISFAE